MPVAGCARRLTNVVDIATLGLMPSMPRTIRLMVLLPLLIAIAGCAGLPSPFPTPVPPDALHPNAPPAVAPRPAVAPVDPVKVGELQRNRATWEALRIGDYSMTVIYGCECALAGRPIDITVRAGRLVGAIDAGNALALDRLTGFPATIDALFEYAERNATAGKVEFKWDPKFGIPTALGVDPDLKARDDEIRIAILEFRPGS